MQHIISFDIGIKNLAFCIFSLSDSNINIVKWGIVNLMPTEEPSAQVMCCKCSKKACATYQGQPFCKVHVKKTGGISSVPKYRTLNKPDLIKLLETYGQIVVNANKAELLVAADEFFKQNAIVPIVPVKKKGANQIHLVTIGENIKTHMDAVLCGLPPMDTVILENQISPIAGRMNTLQGMLAQYFIMQGCRKIEFIASSGKLKDMKTISGTEYKNHKEDGIRFCRMFMKANDTLCQNNVESVLETAIKKDDLADCFLQGVYFLKRENIITYSENLEIKLVS